MRGEAIRRRIRPMAEPMIQKAFVDFRMLVVPVSNSSPPFHLQIVLLHRSLAEGLRESMHRSPLANCTPNAATRPHSAPGGLLVFPNERLPSATPLQLPGAMHSEWWYEDRSG